MVPRVALPFAVLALSLLLTSTTAAMPMRGPVGVPSTPAPGQEIIVTPPADFAWPEALLGAGIATVLCCLLAAVLLTRRHEASAS